MQVFELSGIQRDLLFVVAGANSPNGQEIKAELEETQRREVRRGRLYTNLDALVEAGLIEKGALNGRANRYELTDEGSRQLRTLFEWQRARADFVDEQAVN